MQELQVCPLSGIEEILPGSDLGGALVAAAADNGRPFTDGDICVLAHKIVSKAEGRLVRLAELHPRPAAERLAEMTKKPSTLIECILREATQAFAYQNGTLICHTKQGWTCANAGVDLSNAPGEGIAVLLPLDADASAKTISERITTLTNAQVAVIVTDTHGRSMRNGIVGVAIGCYGIAPLRSYIGGKDRAGHRMEVSIESVADELAGAASLLMGQGNEGIPAVLVRGYDYLFDVQGIHTLRRPIQKELFQPFGAVEIWNAEQEDLP